MNLVQDLFEACARRAPSSTFLIEDGQEVTFGAVDAMSTRLAAALQSEGLRRGDRIAIVMPNSVRLVIALYAVLKAGGVFVILNPDTTVDRVAWVLADCEVSVVIASSASQPVVAPAVARSPSVRSTVWDGEPTADGDVRLQDLLASTETLRPVRQIDVDLAAIIYTSGSTGDPKGVMLMHRNLCSTAHSIAQYLENVPEDIVLGVLPMSFGYGLQQVLVGALVGYSVLIERSFAFPYDVLGRIASHHVTGLPGVPSMFSTILQMHQLAEFDLRSVRYLTNAAANLPVAHIPRLQAAFDGARLFCMYGLTECTRVSYLDPDRLVDKIGSVGRAIPNMEAFVAAPDGGPAAPGEVGELTVRGSGVMLGYWRKPAETAAVLRPGDVPEEPYLRTGDQFRMDEDGFLYFVGRTDDVFKTRGEKVAPREVEGVIYELQSVAEVVVVGVPHEIDGHAVKAIVVARPGMALDERAVRLHCRARLPSHLVPRFVELRDALPKTASGKIRRTGLV